MKTKTKSAKIVDLHPLIGTNIVEHLKHAQAVKRTTGHYMRCRSKLFKAIQNHIVTAKDCVLVDKEGRQVACHRGTGYVVDCKQVIAPFAMPGECQTIMLDIEVGFEPLPDDEVEMVQKRFTIWPPADLELHFSFNKFNLWLDTMRRKRNEEQNKTNLENLQKLILQYPKEARRWIKKSTPKQKVKLSA